MNETNSIINLGDLSKPANTLIEKISDAIGGIFRSHQIRRVAQAEAEADKIRAISQIEISDLKYRALQRFLMEEAKKQNNIESITQKALPSVIDSAQPEQMNDDWITNFFDRCRLISDNQMQSIWSKILAGEANAPGKYSKRTVDILSSLDKSDAELFTNLCAFGVEGIGFFAPLIYDPEHDIYNSKRINFSSLSDLDSLGLIQFDAIAGFIRKGLKQNGFIHYVKQPLWFEFPTSEKYQMQIGYVLLTKAGSELASVTEKNPVEGFTDYLKEKWKGFGYKTEKEIASNTTDH